MCNKVGNPPAQMLLPPSPADAAGADPLSQLLAQVGADPSALRRVIHRLDRAIVERLLQATAGATPALPINAAAPQPICAPPPQPICAPPPPPICAPPPCAPAPQPAAAPPPPPAPAKIKKGKEWNDGMVDASGKPIPKPPKQGSNAHYDKNGNFSKWTSPLTFDLDGDGKVGTAGWQSGKKIDIDGDGKIDQSGWAAKGDGVLAFDRDGNGRAGESGKELLGDATDLGDGRRYQNGFEALKALAEKKLGKQAVADGKLDARELAALEQAGAQGGAGLKMLVDGQERSLRELGISEISLGYQEAGANTDENGNQHRQTGAGFVRNGQRGAVDDVWFQHR